MRKYINLVILICVAFLAYGWNVINLGGGVPSGATTTTSTNGTTASYRSYASNAGSDVDTLTINKPTGTVNGDMMITILTADGNITVSSAPSGWTLTDYVYANGIAGWTYYREADGEGASYQWDFSASNNLAGCVVTCEKSGGSWVAPDGANLHSTATADDASLITTNSVTATDDSILICGFGHDDGKDTVDSPPADMTLVTLTDPGSVSQVVYYESRSSGAVTKSITWPGTDGLTAMALILGAS